MAKKSDNDTIQPKTTDLYNFKKTKRNVTL